MIAIKQVNDLLNIKKLIGFSDNTEQDYDYVYFHNKHVYMFSENNVISQKTKENPNFAVQANILKDVAKTKLPVLYFNLDLLNDSVNIFVNINNKTSIKKHTADVVNIEETHNDFKLERRLLGTLTSNDIDTLKESILNIDDTKVESYTERKKQFDYVNLKAAKQSTKVLLADSYSVYLNDISKLSIPENVSISVHYNTIKLLKKDTKYIVYISNNYSYIYFVAQDSFETTVRGLLCDEDYIDIAGALRKAGTFNHISTCDTKSFLEACKVYATATRTFKVENNKFICTFEQESFSDDITYELKTAKVSETSQTFGHITHFERAVNFFDNKKTATITFSATESGFVILNNKYLIKTFGKSV